MNFNIFGRGGTYESTQEIDCGCRPRHHWGSGFDLHMGKYFSCGKCDSPDHNWTQTCRVKCSDHLGTVDFNRNRSECPKGYKITVKIPSIRFPDGNDVIGNQPSGTVEGFVYCAGCCTSPADYDDAMCRWGNDMPASNNPGGHFTEGNQSENPTYPGYAYIGNYPVMFNLSNSVTGPETFVDKIAVFVKLHVEEAFGDHNRGGRRTTATILLSPYVDSYGKFTFMELGVGGAADPWRFTGTSEFLPGCGCIKECEDITCQAIGHGSLSNWMIASDHHSRPDPTDINNYEYELLNPTGALADATVTVVGIDEATFCYNWDFYKDATGYCDLLPPFYTNSSEPVPL